jgi:hypothetical protein
MASNYSFYSIPVYWFLALAPHAYAVSFSRFQLIPCASTNSYRLA